MTTKHFKRKEIHNESIFSKSLITRNISIPITNISKNIHTIIEIYIKTMYEGKCAVEGFIKNDSCKIITYSSGLIQSTNIKFEVVFECLISCPVEGMRINCIAKNITKAGIRAESIDEVPSPIVVFVARDHHYMSEYFSSIKETDLIEVRVIGQRFELNDKYIAIIASLIEPTRHPLGKSHF
jgi:hypothetical protein